MGKTHRNQKAAKGPAPQLRSRNTRSSKGRLLTDTTSSSTQLTNQLRVLGLYAAHTIGDGNCLFRALSDQLYGSPSKHAELRQQICDHIALHKARYEPFVEDDRGLDDHLRAMRENATYGGHMELSAFANMTGRNVKVIQPGLVYVIECNPSSGLGGSGAPDISSKTPPEEEEPTSPTTPRRSRRMSSTKSIGESGSVKKKIMTEDGQAEVKVKLGKGYYVYEEVTSDEEDAQDSETVEAIVSVDPDLDIDGGISPTVYVAYHDWEHFSSIRNLRGPHTGLPNVAETTSDVIPDAARTELSAKEHDKERKKEWQRKEKERKERERARREKERKEKEQVSTPTGLKVKLKVPPSIASANTSASASTASLVPSGASTPAQSQSVIQDPAQIPLPSSRSASPYVPSTSSSSSLAKATLPASLLPGPSSLSAEVYPEDPSASNAQSQAPPLSSSPRPHEHPRHPHAHVMPQTPRSHYRSPKRSFDESSASGGEDAGTDEERRRRRRVGSSGYSPSTLNSVKGKEKDVLVNLDGNGLVQGSMDVDVSIDVEYIEDADSATGGSITSSLAEGADTPALSAPGSSTGSSSSSPLSSAPASEVSASRGASMDPANISQDDAGDWDDDDNEGDTTVVMDATSLSNSVSSEHTIVQVADTPTSPLTKVAKQAHQRGDSKPLTRRQRKALGLPKPRRGQSAQATGLSAGRIVIPGGKWKGRPESGGDADIAGQDPLRTEWQRNGAGRLDVRGFRELKI